MKETTIIKQAIKKQIEALEKAAKLRNEEGKILGKVYTKLKEKSK